jgi:hypothetical protein
MTMQAPDWIIPLGSGSKSNNDELRILLRSIERYARPLGRVIVVGTALPGWLTGVETLAVADTDKRTKDANLLRKASEAIRRFHVEEAVLTADDRAIMRPLDVAKMPPIWNGWGKSHFAPGEGDKKYWPWNAQMYRTFELAEALGLDLKHHYDSHCPQLFHRAGALMERLGVVDFSLGYCWFTLLRTLERETGGENQSRWRSSHDSMAQVKAPFDKPFAGYTDDGFLNGLRERLFHIFPNKSHFEK